MTTPRRTTLAGTAGLAALLLAVAACGGSEPESKDELGAAEPATSPALTEQPAGTVREIGALPQGIVYDARTRTLAVAVREPYRALLVDPTTFAVRRSVEVPGKVRHLQMAKPGGPLLVPSETANRLYQVPLDGGQVLETDVPEHPHDATGESGFVVSGDEFAGSITVLKGDQRVKTISDLDQPGGVVGDGEGHVAVVDVGDFTVTTYDLRTLQRLDRVPAGAGPTHGVLVGPNRLAVTDTRGGKVLLYSLDPLKQVDSFETGSGPYGLTADQRTGTVWVTLTGSNRLVGLASDGDRLRRVASYPTVRQPDTVAVAPGSRTLWVTGTKDGVVQRITR